MLAAKSLKTYNLQPQVRLQHHEFPPTEKAEFLQQLRWNYRITPSFPSTPGLMHLHGFDASFITKMLRDLSLDNSAISKVQNDRETLLRVSPINSIRNSMFSRIGGIQ
ncbi:hypothetical protein Tco_1008109 [Tanacetum coccineum]